MSRRPVAVLVVLLLGTLSGCANGPGPATPTPTPVAAVPPTARPARPTIPPGQVRLDGGWASVEFEPAAERAFENALVELRTGEPTLGPRPGWTDGRDTVHLPIRDGELVLATTPPHGRVHAEGHLTLARAGTSVEFSDLDVDLDAARVTGTVDGRSTTVFDLDLTRAHVEDLPSLPPMVVDVSGRMTDDARREVRDRLGVDLAPDDTRADLELRLPPG